MDYRQILIILLLPLAGTVLGSACVFFLKRRMPPAVRKAMTGFAAGVMVAASVWSLLIPSMDFSAPSGLTRVMPAAVGFLLGILFLLCLDRATPHQHIDSAVPEGPRSRLTKTSRLALAVTIHNVPEGIAVGIVLAGAIEGSAPLPLSAAAALAIGIAIQNFPEGAIVSVPVRELGNSRRRAFAIGALSGVVEPLASAVTLFAASVLLPFFPYLLAFGAGAMMYVVVEELIPETAQGRHSDIGTIGFALGFVLMMALDTLLG